jgi:hypothetical protein
MDVMKEDAEEEDPFLIALPLNKFGYDVSVRGTVST